MPQIVIPMSGRSQRFLDAGYTVPKPLIQVWSKPMIEHVIQLFDPRDSFVFICAQDHLEDTPLAETLKNLAPHGQIVSIEAHKLGPVHAVLQAKNQLNLSAETIVQYCDFSKNWSYARFLNEMRSHNAMGGLSAYRDFHPHMLGNTNYAFLREQNGWMLDIQEKQPFTNQRMQEYASDGTYYFQSAELMLQAFEAQINEGWQTASEYYVSMAFHHLLQKELPVRVHRIRHMLQWGTPEDLQEFEYQAQIFAIKANYQPAKPLKDSVCLLPMAGEGRRFQKQGFQTAKPQIPVSGRPMHEQALRSLPQTKQVHKVKAKDLKTPSQGQADTCYQGLLKVTGDPAILITACDHGLILAPTAFQGPMKQNADVIAICYAPPPSVAQNPNQWGFVHLHEDGRVHDVHIKQAPQSGLTEAKVISGTFWFQSKTLLLNLLELQRKQQLRVKQEYYVDTLLQIALRQGLQVFGVLAEAAFSWGTPEEWRTFLYWQSFFDEWEPHPYQKAQDPDFQPHTGSREPWNETF